MLAPLGRIGRPRGLSKHEGINMNTIIAALEAAEEALDDLGACDDPDCTEPNCVHALPLVRAALAEIAANQRSLAPATRSGSGLRESENRRRVSRGAQGT